MTSGWLCFCERLCANGQVLGIARAVMERQVKLRGQVFIVKPTCRLNIAVDDDLTHWGIVMHICVSKLTTFVSDNGLPPGRGRAIIWVNAGILFIRPVGANFSEILIKIHIFSFKKMHLKMSSAKCRPFCLGLNVLGTVTVSVMRAIRTYSAMDLLPAIANYTLAIYKDIPSIFRTMLVWDRMKMYPHKYSL